MQPLSLAKIMAEIRPRSPSEFIIMYIGRYWSKFNLFALNVRNVLLCKASSFEYCWISYIHIIYVYCKTLFICEDFIFCVNWREHRDVKIKSLLIISNIRIIEEYMTIRKNEVSWVNLGWSPRENKVMPMISVLQIEIILLTTPNMWSLWGVSLLEKLNLLHLKFFHPQWISILFSPVLSKVT